MTDNNLVKVDPSNLREQKRYIIKDKSGNDYKTMTYVGLSPTRNNTGRFRMFRTNDFQNAESLDTTVYDFYSRIDPNLPPGAGAEGGRKTRKQTLKKRRRASRKKNGLRR